MNFIKKNINELRYADYNPRKKLTPEDKEYQKIKRSIEEFGYVDPIIINKDNTIIGGHQRVTVLKDLGYEEINVIQIDIDKTKEKALNIALNKITGSWDYALLGDLLLDLDSLNYDLEITGFDLDEIEGIMAPLGLEEEKEVIEDDFDCTPPEEPKAKYGDIYQLGNHRLMCGDSTKEEDVAKLMNGNKADMVFTDPPYGVKYEARTGIRSKKIRPEMQMILNDDLEGAELQNFINVVIYNLKLFTKSRAPFYVCNNWHCFETFVESFKINKLKLNAFIIWNKDWMSVGHGDYRSNHEFIFYSKRDGDFYAPKGTENDVWTIRKLSPDKKVHTTEKPVEVSGRAIKNSSKKEDIVLDLFGGSGSTLIASEQLDRYCYTMELDPKYVDVIINRWEAFTGKKAVKIEGEE